MFNSLRTRLTVLFIALTIVPLIIVGTLIARRGSDTLQQEAFQQLEQVTQRTSISLNAFFSERKNELLVLTKTYGFGSLDQAAQKNVLAALLSDQQAYYQLTLIKADGQPAMKLTRGQIIATDNLPSRAEDPLFKAALASNTPHFSAVYFDDNARDRLVTLVMPIEDLFTGKVDSVLIADLRFQNVEESILRNLDLEPGGEVYILDEKGVVIAHRNPNFVLKETILNVPEAGGRHVGLNGADDVLATNTLDLNDLKLTVVAETSFANVTAVASDLTRIATIVTLLTLLVTVAILAFAVNQVVRPILKISRVAEAIQSGDFSKRIDVVRKDEIGQLANAFNEMTVAIEKRETDLHTQANELRSATARAKEAARIKGEFLANVSHELRTPLNAIIGFSDMLLAGMSGPLNDKQTHKMNRLKENGMRLLALINDLLDLTRIESGRLEIVEKAFVVPMMANRVISQMESLAEESHLKFETAISPDMPETVIGDEKRIEQVIVNLLSNAFKFTKEGSVVLNIGVNRAEKIWTLDVTDTGIGIPPHALNIIFEEFRQLDGSYSRAYKGSGLGLAITRNLVRTMGGKISVKSTQGTGSTFTVVLPLMLPEQETSVPTIVQALTN